MQNIEVETYEQAIAKVASSIDLFKRFVKTLNKFLKAYKLGKVYWMPTTPESSEDHGFSFARVTLEADRDIMYLDLYSDGTATGENFALDEGSVLYTRGNHPSWNEVIDEMLRTAGILTHTELSQTKIDKIIELLEK